MMDWNRPRLTPRTRIAGAAVALLAIGAAGGAGAISLTRPTIEMAPTVPTAIAKLPQTSGVVTVKGQVAEVYGDHFVLGDGSGRALVDAGRDGDSVRAGSALTVQGHYRDGQLRASYLVDPDGQIDQVGPPPRPDRAGPRGDGPPSPPPPGRPGAVPPPPPPGGLGMPPPPPAGPGMPPLPGTPAAGVAAGQLPPPPPPGAPASQAGPTPPAATATGATPRG